MATETYTTVYIADASAFVAGSRQVEQSLARVDLAVARTRANLTGFAAGGGRSASAAAKNVDRLMASLNGVPGAANQAKQSLNGLGSAASGAGRSGDMLAAATGGWITQAFAVAKAWQAAAAAIDGYSKAVENARVHTEQGAKAGLDQRDKAREYAKLAEANDPTDAVMGRLHDIQLAGGYKFDDAKEFGEAFLGAIPAGRKKGHTTPGIEKGLEAQAAAFSAAYGLDPQTGGLLAGMIPMYSDLTKDERGNPLTDEQGIAKGMGQMGGMILALNDGVGKVSTLAKGEIKAAATAVGDGHVQDLAEFGAFISTASLIGPASGASAAFEQYDRLINKPNKEGAEFLKRTGVADQVGDLEKTRKLKQHLDAVRAASPDPANFDRKGYLINNGFGNVKEVDRTIGFIDNFEVLEKTARESRAKARTPQGQAAVQAGVRQFRASLDGQYRIGKAQKEIGDYQQTEKNQRFEAAREAAEGQLRDPKNPQIDTKSTNVADFLQDWTVGNFFSETSRNQRINDQVLANFRSAVKRAGIEDQVRAYDPSLLGFQDAHDASGVPVTPYDGQDTNAIAEGLNRFGPELEKRGVSISDQGAGGIKANVDAAKKGQPRAGGANAGVDPGALNAPAAAGAGGKVAAVDGSALDKASGKLDQAAGALMAAARAMSNGRPAPGGDLGGPYGPYRA